MTKSKTTNKEEKKMNPEFTTLSLKDIHPNQNYKRFQAMQDKETYSTQLLELANSIKENGLINPITVIQTGKTYTIVAGNRRYAACKSLGMETVPVHIMQGEEFSLALTSNITAMDMTLIEKGVWVRDALTHYKGIEPYKSSKTPVEDIYTYLSTLLGKEVRTLREWVNKAQGETPEGNVGDGEGEGEENKRGRKAGQSTKAEKCKAAKKGFISTAEKMAEYAKIISKYPDEFKQEATFTKVFDILLSSLKGLEKKLQD